MSSLHYTMMYLCVLIAFFSTAGTAFVLLPHAPRTTTPTSTTILHLPNRCTLMAKKKSNTSRAKGFGKVEEETEESTTTMSSGTAAASTPDQQTTPQPFLQSIKEDQLSPEERAKRVLREKYGMKTLEEQQLDAKQLEALNERRRKLAEWKKAAEQDEDIDIMAMLPEPVVIFIDRFLKIGVAVTGVLFIAAGLGITLEAWSKTSGQPLPENIDTFITSTVEPNFTVGLLVLLGFSVSLGLFAAAQLSSSGAQYRED